MSLCTDLADGFALEKCLRTAVLATRIARSVSDDPEVHRTTYWASLLRFTGCTAYAHEEGRHYAAGDDISLRATLAYVDFGRPATFVGRALRGIARDAPLVARIRAVGSLVASPAAPARHAEAQCEVGAAFARTVDMPAVAEVLSLRDERWDGRGPRGVARAEAIPLAARIADVADVVELFAWSYGPEQAQDELERRAGGQLDPALVVHVRDHAPALLLGLFESTVWDLFLEAEPAPHRIAATPAERLACFEAFSRIADVQSVYTLGHSPRVAALAMRAAEVLGLPEPERVLAREAGFVHDLGRVAVPVGIWEKRAPLTAFERERIRTHSHQTETVLRLAPGLAPVAEIAAAAHERAGGQGYHRRLRADATPVTARLLAAADVCVALASDRPHRPRRGPDEVVRELRGLVTEGALDARAADAVLEAARFAAPTRRRDARHLTDREREVVRLVAVGRTNKEIGALLGMSPRTAQKHVMNVYQKVGLESRAGLALYAVEHDLLDPDDD